ncbi:unnamed protein product [Rhizoctonia solani]|uniref:Rho1 guanine nucleotide exchange factor 1 [Schizosaccharomyces pombe 972h-] n=1 Tax=Rhizoctonia solani TaxID=456999 RepID=A0A8H3A784_9AGAM|nr:unnamed protein product [Rhizoctonia solani]
MESVSPVPVGDNKGTTERREHTYANWIGNIPSGQNGYMSTSEGPTHPSTTAPQPRKHAKSRRRPLVYPALLSRVAKEFYKRVSLTDFTRGGLTHAATFNGLEAVTLIAHIIKTSDRSLALLLGRALGAQRFFHDVRYYRQLCDSPVEIYQFTNLSRNTTRIENRKSTVRPDPLNPSKGSKFGAGSTNGDANASGEGGPVLLPSGVFTILTKCYSPTCSKDRVCYSSSRPRRLELDQKYPACHQHHISNVAFGSILNTTTTTQLLEDNSNERIEHNLKVPSQIWPHSATDGVNDQENKRRKAIQEIIYAECSFVQDLEYLRDHWMEPLRTQEIIPPNRRTYFVRQVFWNIEEILDVNRRFCAVLTTRQKVAHDVEFIGGVFLEMAPHFRLFARYDKHRIWAEHELEKEKLSNPVFTSFTEKVEQLPASRGLELTRYLIKPTVHLAHLLHLLNVVLEYTPEGGRDQVMIPRAIDTIHKFLAKVNEDSESTLLQLNKELIFGPGEEVDLGLNDEQRQLIYKGRFKHRGGVIKGNDDLQAFLLDHTLLIAKSKKGDKCEQLKLFKRPIPLELLTVSVPDEDEGPFFKSDSQKHRYQLAFSHLGREGYRLTLWAPTFSDRNEWVENITVRQRAVREQRRVFTTYPLSGRVFTDAVKVNCAVLYGESVSSSKQELKVDEKVADHGQRIAYGTEEGVYLQSLYGGRPSKYLDLPDVQQIDILEEYQLLIVLSGGTVFTCSLSAPNIGNPMTYKIALHVSFFTVGYCLNRTLICIAGVNTPEGTTIRIKEIYAIVHGIGMLIFKESICEALEAFKELHIPTGAHSFRFLETQLCIMCTKGFKMLNFNTLEIYSLLDPTDPSLDFVRCKDVHALSMYQIDGLFLLCYTEFAFYVYDAGRRSRNDMIIRWEGTPTAFALQYPYIMAFDQMFVEIRHVENGSLVQIIRGNNLRLLYADTQLPNIDSTSPKSSNRSGSSLSTQDLQGRAKRDEIILASDDGVMTVQLSGLLPLTSNKLLATNV